MKILVVEDEKGLAESISEYLSKEGFVVETADEFNLAHEKISLYNYDCAIVDLNLPNGTGFDIVSYIKSKDVSTGIIIISARNALEDKIRGLEIGSDDYLIKPFHLSELNARVKSLIRRRQFGGTNEMTYKEININLNSRKVFANNSNVVLSRKEFDLLMYFISNINVVLTKPAIAEHLYGDYIDSSDSFDMLYSQIKNLRKKLTESGCNDYIQTIYGIGYKFGLE
ncbi:response regulator transcription factor [Reichenbachiella carrageenanivorans]|uniref:Response regulator transcription factor n=1 Tax=Reichenbachiella carrageenanivorans TaxID=2979869 RepID=A0ABY6CX75_9BACT|nr:response regulator transcription factor [Reichenbachiella carrageenanivorans]UXX78473.1 response regulator transcription factor [Reichenbachiella carrageenanivorans]